MEIQFSLRNGTARRYAEALGFTKTCKPDQPFVFASQFLPGAWFFVVVSHDLTRNEVTFVTEATCDEMKEKLASWWRLPVSAVNIRPIAHAPESNPGRN